MPVVVALVVLAILGLPPVALAWRAVRGPSPGWVATTVVSVALYAAPLAYAVAQGWEIGAVEAALLGFMALAALGFSVLALQRQEDPRVR